MDNKKRTEIATLGEFGLIRELTKGLRDVNATTVFGVAGMNAPAAKGKKAAAKVPSRDMGDDAAVILPNPDCPDYTLLTTDLLLEGIQFDLTYFPLKHLGYKAVVTGINDIYAMNGIPHQLTLSLGISAKLSVEHMEELYEGVKLACEEYKVDLVGGDTTASMNGLVISVTVVGQVAKGKIAYRHGAQLNDLICITGDLGSAYMGLHLLEREKRALSGVKDPEPKFKGYEYLLQRQLKPVARKGVVDALAEAGIVPTSMTDLSDGLSSDLLHICRQSHCGARIYLDRIPIAKETYSLAEELHADPVVAALNGGDDHELLFTVPLALQEQVMRLGGVEVIGHITAESTGVALTTPDGSDIPLTAQGWGTTDATK